MTGSTRLRVEVIAVGNELLAGDILDTNFGAIARELKEIGVEIARHVTVPDIRETIAAQARESLGRAQVVIVTGGLGPTADDLTRFGVADALGAGLVKNDAAMVTLRERFLRFGVTDMPPTNEVQTLFPEGATVLENPNGTAAGFLCEVAGDGGGRAVFVLPGPPRELMPMITQHVTPYLASRWPLPLIRVKRLRTLGIGESSLAVRIAAWPFGIEGVELGYYPQEPGVDLKITSRGTDPAAVETALEAAARRLREILGEHVYGEERTALAEVVGALLRSGGETLSAAESCTGGLAASLITSVPGSSDYFDGGVVTYSNESKEALLGIAPALIQSKGAVSGEVAAAMAEGVRRIRGTTWGIGITGIAGPDGGTAEKPVGLVYIAVAGPAGTGVWRTNHAGGRVAIQRRAAVTALDHLRRQIVRSRQS